MYVRGKMKEFMNDLVSFEDKTTKNCCKIIINYWEIFVY